MKSKLRYVLVLFLSAFLLAGVPALAYAAQDMKVEVVRTSSDFGSGYFVEYKINGIAYRSDVAGERINQIAWEHMSDADKTLTMEGIGWMIHVRKRQFGSAFSREMAKWYDTQEGWTQGREVLKSRLAANNFPEYHAIFGDLNNRRKYYEDNLKPDDGYLNYPETTQMFEEQELVWNWACETYEAMERAQQMQTRMAVQSLSGDLIKLITDRCLVPNITPAGMGGTTTTIATEIFGYIDSITGITDSVQGKVIGGRMSASSVRAVIEELAGTIDMQKAIIDKCLSRAEALKDEINRKIPELEAKYNKMSEDEQKACFEENKALVAASPVTETPDPDIVEENRVLKKAYETAKSATYPTEEERDRVLNGKRNAITGYNQSKYDEAMQDVVSLCIKYLGTTEPGRFNDSGVVGNYVNTFPEQPQYSSSDDPKPDTVVYDPLTVSSLVSFPAGEGLSLYMTSEQLAKVDKQVRDWAQKNVEYQTACIEKYTGAHDNAVTARREISRIYSVLNALDEECLTKSESQRALEKSLSYCLGIINRYANISYLAELEDYFGSTPDSPEMQTIKSEAIASAQRVIDYYAEGGEFLERFDTAKKQLEEAQNAVRWLTGVFENYEELYENAWASYRELYQQREAIFKNMPDELAWTCEEGHSVLGSKEFQRLFGEENPQGTRKDVERIGAESEQVVQELNRIDEQMGKVAWDIEAYANTLTHLNTSELANALNCENESLKSGAERWNGIDDEYWEPSIEGLENGRVIETGYGARAAYIGDESVDSLPIMHSRAQYTLRTIRDDFDGRTGAHERWLEIFGEMSDNKAKFTTTASAEEGGYLSLKQEAQSISRTYGSWAVNVVERPGLAANEPDPYDDLLVPMIKEIDKAREKNGVPLSIEGSYGGIAVKGVSDYMHMSYTGKPIKPKPVIKMNGKKLVENTDYKLSYKNNVNVGVAIMTITGIGRYCGSTQLHFVIDKAANPLRVAGKTATVNYARLKKADQVIPTQKAFTVKKAQGKVTYAKNSGSKKIAVNKKTGKITVKKGLKKNTYKVDIRVTASGTKNYERASRDVTIVIKVK